MTCEVMEPPDENIGQMAGNYLLKQSLGRGAMGTVYLAEHPRIKRRVAVKVLARHLAIQPEMAQRFENEAEAASVLQHRSIIEIFDFGKLADGTPYIAMELLEGEELKQSLRRRKRLTPAEVLPYLEPICAALQVAHDRGVVHRDLKPENIFVLKGDELAIKLLDFGIAKMLESDEGTAMTSTGMVLGSPVFLAPEQAAGEHEKIGPATDIYSLGVILYLMLAGAPPFLARSSGMLIAMHIKDTPPPLASRSPEVPAEVAAVVHRCLEKEPARRPASATEVLRLFAQAVERAALPEQAAAEPTTPVKEPAARLMRKTRVEPAVLAPADAMADPAQETRVEPAALAPSDAMADPAQEAEEEVIPLEELLPAAHGPQSLDDGLTAVDATVLPPDDGLDMIPTVIAEESTPAAPALDMCATVPLEASLPAEQAQEPPVEAPPAAAAMSREEKPAAGAPGQPPGRGRRIKLMAGGVLLLAAGALALVFTAGGEGDGGQPARQTSSPAPRPPPPPAPASDLAIGVAPDREIPVKPDQEIPVKPDLGIGVEPDLGVDARPDLVVDVGPDQAARLLRKKPERTGRRKRRTKGGGAGKKKKLGEGIVNF